jgi:hypothetical protein
VEHQPGNVQPFVADGGLQAAAPSHRDPYEALDDLMAVVEVLCPVWPLRGTFDPELRGRL